MILTPIWMAFWSRAAGGGRPNIPWNFDQLLYALPILLFYPYISAWALIAYLGCAAGKVMGTRQYLDMGNHIGEIREPNNVDFLIKWLEPKVTPYWYDFIGNTVMGIVSMLVPALILAFHGLYLAALPLIVCGAMRGIAYAIGWAIIPEWHRPKWPEYIGYSTAIAELFAGAFIGLGIVMALVVLS